MSGRAFGLGRFAFWHDECLISPRNYFIDGVEMCRYLARVAKDCGSRRKGEHDNLSDTRVAPRLMFRYGIFQDQFGNYVIMDPMMEKPLGLPDDYNRRPSVYIAATDGELKIALEATLYEYEQKSKVNGEHLALVMKVRESLARNSGRQYPTLH